MARNLGSRIPGFGFHSAFRNPQSAITLFALLAAPALALQPPHDASNNIGCASCHGTHRGSFGFLPRGAQQTALCQSCHNPAGQASTMVDIGTEIHGGTGGPTVDCGYCHDVHATENGANIKLIRTNTTKYVAAAATPAVYQQKPGDFARSDGPPYKGICQTCHTAASYHRNDGTGDTTHANDDPDSARGGNCFACHGHGNSFEPAGSCLDCHSSAQPPRRREVVSEFGLASHHAGSVTEADCQLCHDQAQHRTDPYQVRVKNVDTGAVAATLAGNPATNSTEAAKLEPHCLSCHDANGAAGDTTPFADGVAVPAIDSAAWTAGRHKTANMNCYGDGATFGCHASGHGSEKAKLRAPSAGAPIPPDNVAQEEGFCYACHDSNGPSTKDLQTAMARTYHHPVNNSDPRRPTNGRKVECTTCHRQHYVKSTPAHTTGNTPSGRIEGVRGVNASGNPVSSISYEYELCFLCHAGYAGAGSNPGDGGPDPVSNKATLLNVGAGTGTATSAGTTTTVNNSAGGYTPDALVGWFITFTGGTSNNLGAQRKITANTATQIAWSGALSRATATGDAYRLIAGTFHPVVKAQGNPYCTATAANGNIVTMETPWNQTAGTHNTMWCSDCHRDTGLAGPHGTNNKPLLVAGLSAVETTSGSGDWHTPLCIRCHKKSVYVAGGNGSRFSAHNNNNHRKPNYTRTSDGKVRYGGCLSCHYGGGPEVPMNGVHGWTNTTWTFINGNSVTAWTPGSCTVLDGGGSTCNGHSRTY